MTWKGGGGNDREDLAMKSKGQEGVKEKLMASSFIIGRGVAIITSLWVLSYRKVGRRA